MSLQLWLPPALSNRRVQLYVAGHLVSVIGTWFQAIALAWLIYRLTGSAFYLGAAGFALHLPFLFISPFAGLAVDRWPRVTVLLVIDCILITLALGLALVSAIGVTNVWVYLTFALLIGISNAIETPARQSLFTALVDDRSQLPSMIGISSATFNLGRLIGPALAGVALVYVSESVCFLVNALSFLAIIAAILALRLPNARPDSKASPTAPNAATEAPAPSGYKDLLKLSSVRFLLPIMSAIGLFGVSHIQLKPSIADRLYGGGSASTGLLMAAGGAGALLGSITFTLARNGRLMLRLVRIAPLLLGASLVAMAFTRSLWLGAALVLIIGFAVMSQAASTNTLIQQSVPEHLRGRAISLYLMAYNGMGPFGHLVSGAVGERWGLPATLAMNGVLILVVAAIALRRLQRSETARNDLERAAGLK